ncbi:hypothetical protein PtA15_6A696 [Puccinia triticina]|uniref:mannan endo-1,4-beta-mannosidase n=1 Tax=Puccinia triticina TaxID=208348 RepID=A0ABY7CPK4_9BASI|nr:uncharacterized protein PtA15_6A696 [Puccinia triticina]WAQ86066.1 hypothetical protein PtA15_6A696 [Puccinia triticina]
MIKCFKKIISFYLNRINTFNGIRIGSDETILAFETGNEMNWGYQNGSDAHDRPAPASWTIEIAQFIKSLAPKTLVMDGSYSRNPDLAWEEETLASPHIDIYSYHFYGEGDTQAYHALENQVRAHGKTFIVGEHGFYDKVAVWEAFYKNVTCPGALVWSMRGHSENGGFVTHGEGNNIYSYHAPGFRNQTSENFDTQEADVISLTYDASYRILGLSPPRKPIPATPDAFLVSNGTHAGISWRGAAWAQEYQVLGAVFQDAQFSIISRYTPDNFDDGQLFVPLDPTDPTKPIHIKLPEPIPHQSHADIKPPITYRRLMPMTAPAGQISTKNRDLNPAANNSFPSGGWFSTKFGKNEACLPLNVLTMIQARARCLIWGFCLWRLAISSMKNAREPLSLPAGAPLNDTRSDTKLVRRYLHKPKYTSARGSRPGFVSAPGDGHFYLDGELFDFRSFNTPTLLNGVEFRARDLVETISAFGSPVARTYTLHVANSMFKDGKQNPSSSHILGWDNSANDWIYNETNWKNIDQALDLARQHGVKLIIPIINQDYGSDDSDWVGNINDLVRHRYNIQSYTVAQKAVDWFTDFEMIRCFKKIISFYLNRINTFNGIRIGSDETILAFETGNEMNWGYQNGSDAHDRPAPASWTIEIAEFIKSLAPNTLVMDGSYSRNPKLAWEAEALASPHIDLYSFHFYGEGEIQSYRVLENQVRAHGKTFIIGEHGFYDKITVWEAFYQNVTCPGALVWSMRGHSENGGFVTHGEGHNIYSYHAPGFRNQTSENFDTQEADVISLTYDASYRILGLSPPRKPIPATPDAFLVSNGTHAGISWRGAAWAQEYQVLGAVFRDAQFSIISRYTPDNFDDGQLFVPLDPTDPTKPIYINLPEPIPHQSHAGWIDTKWCPPGSSAPCGDIHFAKQEDLKPRINYRRLKPMSPPPEQISVKNRQPNPIAQKSFISGGWFSAHLGDIE